MWLASGSLIDEVGHGRVVSGTCARSPSSPSVATSSPEQRLSSPLFIRLTSPPLIPTFSRGNLVALAAPPR
jgi:hypothetical protein